MKVQPAIFELPCEEGWEWEPQISKFDQFCSFTFCHIGDYEKLIKVKFAAEELILT